MFKNGKKDVLVATDVASKGLDFPEIQHVINYDMPKEIENYSKSRTAIYWDFGTNKEHLCSSPYWSYWPSWTAWTRNNIRQQI